MGERDLRDMDLSGVLRKTQRLGSSSQVSLWYRHRIEHLWVCVFLFWREGKKLEVILHPMHLCSVISIHNILLDLF